MDHTSRCDLPQCSLPNPVTLKEEVDDHNHGQHPIVMGCSRGDFGLPYNADDGI